MKLLPHLWLTHAHQAGIPHAIIEPELGLYNGLFLLPLGRQMAEEFVPPGAGKIWEIEALLHMKHHIFCERTS